MEAFAGFSELVDHRVFADSARAGDDDDELIRRRDDGVGCEGEPRWNSRERRVSCLVGDGIGCGLSDILKEEKE